MTRGRGFAIAGIVVLIGLATLAVTILSPSPQPPEARGSEIVETVIGEPESTASPPRTSSGAVPQPVEPGRPIPPRSAPLPTSVRRDVPPPAPAEHPRHAVEASAWMATSIRLNGEGHAARALEAALRAWDEKPTADIASHVAGLHLEAGRAEEALTWAARAVASNPDSPAGWIHLGQARLATDDAIGALEAFLRAADGSWKARAGVGAAHRALGDLPAAVEAFEHALRMAPDEADAAFYLGRAYRDAGRSEDAVHAFRRYVDLERDVKSARRASVLSWLSYLPG